VSDSAIMPLQRAQTAVASFIIDRWLILGPKYLPTVIHGVTDQPRLKLANAGSDHVTQALRACGRRFQWPSVVRRCMQFTRSDPGRQCPTYTFRRRLANVPTMSRLRSADSAQCRHRANEMMHRRIRRTGVFDSRTLHATVGTCLAYTYIYIYIYIYIYSEGTYWLVRYLVNSSKFAIRNAPCRYWLGTLACFVLFVLLDEIEFK